MRIKFPTIITMLVVLAIVCSLVAITAMPAGAALGISLSTSSGAVGTTVTITATDFPPTTILTATYGGAVLVTAPTTVTTSAGGAASFAVAIPASTAGAHTIKVTDGVNEPTASFTVTPKVKVSPTSGPVGTSITVTGTGFSGAGVTADVTINGTVIASGAVVDSTGGFTATGAVPSLSSGGKTVSASDGAGNVAVTTATFTVTPTLSVSPTSGLAGTVVTISGNGWASTPAVTVTFAGGTPVDLTPTSSGLLSGSYTIPVAASAGVKTVVGTQGATSASTTFTVASRLLTLTPSSGPKGTQVLITGSNMTPNGTIGVGALTFGGAAWNTAVINIDSTGVISPTTLRVPSGAVVGAGTVMATDSGTLIGLGSFTVTKPTVAVNPISGPKSSAVTITGSGWLSGATVTLTFAGNSMTTVPDGSGNIAAALNVPTAAVVGENSITASDTYTNSATAAIFTVPAATITVSPTSGPAGTVVTVTGSGFGAFTAVTVKIGSYTYLQQPLSDALGAFSSTITVPGLAPGSQVISGNDGVNNVTAFFVISTAPTTVASALAGISGKLVRVWGYSGTWSMYDPADAAGSTLASLTAGKGYWMNVSEAVTLIYSGYSYALSAGWNLIGWR